MNIYSNPQLYDAIHQYHKWDLNLIRSIANNFDGPVLELASGTGRLSQGIIELGLDYTGLDLSKSFLETAKKQFGHNARFILGDMRAFNIGGKFDFIFIGFNSFLHNLTIKDAKNCLECINSHLSNHGCFLLSIFMPDPIFLYREEDKSYPATDYFKFENSRCRIMEKNRYNPQTQINELRWFVERDGKISSEEYHFSMRMFYPHEMDIILSESGFIIKDKIGDYDGSPMDEESGMQIYVCKKY